MNIEKRMQRWVDFNQKRGFALVRIAIHPRDVARAPAVYAGLPVVGLGE